jgi:hypothetical protein
VISDFHFTCSNTRVLYYLICSCFHETIEMHDNCDLHDQNAIDSYDHPTTRQSPTTKFQLDPKSLHILHDKDSENVR